MPFFRKKPAVIESVQFRGFDGSGVPLAPWPPGWNVSAWRTWPAEGPPLSLVIPTLEGDHHATPGDWIIRGVKGEFYPCKPRHLRGDLRARPAPRRGREEDAVSRPKANRHRCRDCADYRPGFTGCAAGWFQTKAPNECADFMRRAQPSPGDARKETDRG